MEKKVLICLIFAVLIITSIPAYLVYKLYNEKSQGGDSSVFNFKILFESNRGLTDFLVAATLLGLTSSFLIILYLMKKS